MRRLLQWARGDGAGPGFGSERGKWGSGHILIRDGMWRVRKGDQDDVGVVAPVGVGAVSGAQEERVWERGEIRSLVLNMLSLRGGVGSVGMQVGAQGGGGWEYKFGSHSCRVDELILRIFRRRSVRGPPDTPGFHEQMPVQCQEWGVLGQTSRRQRPGLSHSGAQAGGQMGRTHPPSLPAWPLGRPRPWERGRGAGSSGSGIRPRFAAQPSTCKLSPLSRYFLICKMGII